MATPSEIAASLTMEDIPVKLRCATCNKLAMDAFRMPCCDQSICEDCQASLPEACPVCFHEPVKADDCRPNKALRTTIKVFLRKKVMERDAAEKKKKAAEKAAAAPDTAVPEETVARQKSQIPELASQPAIKPFNNVLKPASREASQVPQTPNESAKAIELHMPTEAQKDVPQASIESPGPDVARRASTQTAGDGGGVQEKETDNDKQSEHQSTTGENQQLAANNGFEQGMNSGALGFDGANSGFPNMGLNGMGDFSQMMPFMPNGMPNNMMGAFPNMMGVPGMGMDPMSMSQMYGGFGGQGVGMNSMNMGVGFDAGQGAFGGFHGQSAAWNAGQNNYNQNAYGNHASMRTMGGGDYGANAGYGGYNMPPHQGNFNQMHHHQYPNNDFHHGHHGQGFQTRGRGRGRGYPYAGRGRGGFNQYNQSNQAQGNNQANSEAPHQQFPEVTRRGSPSYGPLSDQAVQESKKEEEQDAKAESTTNDITAEEQLSKELDPGDADDHAEIPTDPVPKEEPKHEPIIESLADAVETAVPQTKTPDQQEVNLESKEEEEKPAPIQTYMSDEPANSKPSIVPIDTAIPSTMPPPPSPIIPTGPAAFHADSSTDTSPRGRGGSRGFGRGIDYRALSLGRGTGFLPNGNISHSQPAPAVKAPPVAPKGLGVEGAPTGPKALREGLPNTGIKGFSIVGRASAAAQARPNGTATARSPSRERSRSPSRHRSSHHRHHRHRSTSPYSSPERDRRRERRHRHSRRHEDESEDERHGTKSSRTRDTSADSSSKRRSRRYHDEEKDRYRERSSHRSRRSHRERSRERERSRDGGKERDRDKDREERTSKKKEKTPELSINGASGRTNGTTSTRHKYDDKHSPPPSSRKRRSDDEDDHREQKRRRQEEREEKSEKDHDRSNGTHHRSSRLSKRDNITSSTTNPPTATKHDKPPPPSLIKEPPKGPKRDSLILETNNSNTNINKNNILSERDKYAAERIARENQRRLSQKGAPPPPPAGPAAKAAGALNGSGGGGGLGRRIGHQRYEDEETVLRGESEREAGRWR